MYSIPKITATINARNDYDGASLFKITMSGSDLPGKKLPATMSFRSIPEHLAKVHFSRQRTLVIELALEFI